MKVSCQIPRQLLYLLLRTSYPNLITNVGHIHYMVNPIPLSAIPIVNWSIAFDACPQNNHLLFQLKMYRKSTRVLDMNAIHHRSIFTSVEDVGHKQNIAMLCRLMFKHKIDQHTKECYFECVTNLQFNRLVQENHKQHVVVLKLYRLDMQLIFLFFCPVQVLLNFFLTTWWLRNFFNCPLGSLTTQDLRQIFNSWKRKYPISRNEKKEAPIARPIQPPIWAERKSVLVY